VRKKREKTTGQKYNGLPYNIVQALADISRSALCCHSNETFAPIASPPNSAQLEDTPYHSPNLHPGPCSGVGIQQGTDRHTDGHDQHTFRLGYALHEMK